MGNTSSVLGPTSPSEGNGDNGKSSSGSGKKGRKSSSGGNGNSSAAAQAAESATERAKKVLDGVQESLKSSVKKLEDQDHPAAHLIDTVCGPYFDGGGKKKNGKRGSKGGRDTRAVNSFYSDDNSDDMDDSRGTMSEDEQTLDTDYNASTVNSTVASTTGPEDTAKKGSKKDSMDSSYLSQSDYESDAKDNHHHRKGRGKRDKHHHHRDREHGHRHRHHHNSDDPSSMASFDEDEDDDSKTMDTTTSGTANTSPSKANAAKPLLSKPLASSFAKRCYFTKAGIGKTTQHYEGLTLTGNVVLMLAAAMKLKGCPTICDEDLRRVEQTYPNQFSRLPDELLLSSGWRRISKYCHFSNKPIPDGIPFFHSKQRLHPQGGYYFLLAAAVGMVRPIDVEPLTRDTLVLLETDYPSQCDAAPEVLIQDPDEWTLVEKFCFFSGGPINTDEDVYYQADFDGNPIYMLAFLSPSLTPEELYKLDQTGEGNEEHPFGLTSVAGVQEVETVYDLTDRDFHDLKLYHLGPCRALPQYILQPQAWIKVLPPHFLEARHRALLRAQDYEMQNGGPVTPLPQDPSAAQARHLTVGATPIDGRYGAAPSPYQQQIHYDPDGNPHGHQMGPPGPSPHMPNEHGYYMQESPMNGGQGFSSEYEAAGPNNSASMGDTAMAAYSQQQAPTLYNQQQHPQQQHYHQEHSPHYQQYGQQHQSPHHDGSNAGSHLMYQDDDKSRQSSSFQREVEEEGAFLDTNAAPLDEAIGTRMGALDPPEHKPLDPAIDDSMAVSEAVSGNPNNASNTDVSYYSHPDDQLQVSKTESQYSNDMANSPARGDAPAYSYSQSPEKTAEYYHHQEQSRDDQYYDSPEGLKEHPGSQDHEFFNAHSGGGEEEEDFDPNAVPSFDHADHLMGHPDDQQFANGEAPVYYGDESPSRLELQDSSSAEYFGGEHGEDSPSPIKTDHLRRLGRHPQQMSPHRPNALGTPTSQASSQNSVSEFSHTSAMRGAQELLKRNRQRRHEHARRRLQNTNGEVRMGESTDIDGSPMKASAHYAFAPDEAPLSPGDSPHLGAEGEGGVSWDESANDSEALNSTISGSSVWTDNSSNPADRSSRRALILQMAKARMKSNKDRDPAETTIKEEKSGSSMDGYSDGGFDEPQGSAELIANDLDFAVDLD